MTAVAAGYHQFIGRLLIVPCISVRAPRRHHVGGSDAMCVDLMSRAGAAQRILIGRVTCRYLHLLTFEGLLPSLFMGRGWGFFRGLHLMMSLQWPCDQKCTCEFCGRDAPPSLYHLHALPHIHSLRLLSLPLPKRTSSPLSTGCSLQPHHARR